jgi:hypothetical protein
MIVNTGGIVTGIFNTKTRWGINPECTTEYKVECENLILNLRS